MEFDRSQVILGVPLPFNRYDPVSGTVEAGHMYPVHDNVTGYNGKVFIPDSVHTQEGTDTLIAHALAPIRANLSANPS